MSDILTKIEAYKRDEMLQPRRGRAAVERFGAERDAFLEVFGFAGHDQRRGSVEQSNIAIGARLAVEHRLQRHRIGIGVTAPERIAADAAKTGILRRDLEAADIAVLERGDKGRPGEGDLVEPV